MRRTQPRLVKVVLVASALLACSSDPEQGGSSGAAPSPDAGVPEAGDPQVDGGAGDADADADDGPVAPARQVLFDGSDTSAWKMAGLGSFDVVDGSLVANPDDGLGLYWCTFVTPADFELELEWRRTGEDDNSGVFVRFPDPDSQGYDNTAWVAVHFGFEVQIDETGAPDGAAVHKTGAIYEQADQQLSQIPALPVGEWNQYRISVVGQTYRVVLNGTQVTEWSFPGDPNAPERGLPSTPEQPRYIGLQSHTGHVEFRNVVLHAP